MESVYRWTQRASLCLPNKHFAQNKLQRKPQSLWVAFRTPIPPQFLDWRLSFILVFRRPLNWLPAHCVGSVFVGAAFPRNVIKTSQRNCSWNIRPCSNCLHTDLRLMYRVDLRNVNDGNIRFFLWKIFVKECLIGNYSIYISCRKSSIHGISYIINTHHNL